MSKYGMNFRTKSVNLVIVMSEYNGYKNFEEIFTNEEAANNYMEYERQQYRNGGRYFYKLFVPSAISEVILHDCDCDY